MINTPTVLVLGAGASKAYGFPSGQELKDQICDELEDGAQQLYRTFVEGDYANAVEFVRQFREDLKGSPRYSVDAFLEDQKDYLEIGKRAIADVLLRCEKTKNLFENFITKRVNQKIRKGEEDWYKYLYNNHLSDGPFEEFGRHSLKIITFNYDRSFEQYLFECLKQINSNDIECAKQVLRITIVHVYGKLGALPWMALKANSTPAGLIEGEETDLKIIRYDSYKPDKPAGVEVPPEDWKRTVKRAAMSIKINPDDDVEVSEKFDRAHDFLKEAERIYFLGFGFNETNVTRLMPNKLMKTCVDKCRGTTFGLGRPQRNMLKRMGLGNIDNVRGYAHNKDEELFPDVTIYDFLHSSHEAIIS